MDFLVPKLSATMESAKVLRWLKQPGDKIRSGDPLVELETDKAAMEVESPVDGVLGAIAAPEGVDVAIGGKLADIAEAAGSAPPAPAKPAAPPQQKPPPAPAARAPAPSPPAAPTPAPAQPAAASKGGAPRILASPLARRLAREQGLDLAALARAKDGRVRKADILAARRSAAVAPTVGQLLPPQFAVSDGTAVPLTSMRARIAETVTVSRQTIPAFSLDRFVSTEAIARARATIGADIERDAGIRLTTTDFFLQALADTLFHNPAMLQRFADAGGRPGSVRDGSVNIGLVVAVEGGMMIPVVADIGGRSLAEIGIARRDATQRVRSGRLSAGDGTPVPIALSNLSRGGADRFEAIIGPGQSSVLAVGREHEAVVARGGQPVVVTGVHLTLSVDHRLIDGVVGATFLGQLADRIEFGPWQAG